MTTNLRAALKQSSQIAWATRIRIIQALDAFDAGTEPTCPAGRVLLLIIAMAEICCTPGAENCPDSQWAVGSLERHISTNMKP